MASLVLVQVEKLALNQNQLDTKLSSMIVAPKEKLVRHRFGLSMPTQTISPLVKPSGSAKKIVVNQADYSDILAWFCPAKLSIASDKLTQSKNS
jgi:hypothetical protein